MRLGALRHEEITKNLVKENQNLIALIEDDDLLEELENKLRSSEELEDFTN
jgi:16S rRNA A1518/A1519 N6-dimethyltransferase RsmA/KsgA/DIM1 with predicted DNA glycosylase/AP lyase activity